MATEGYSGKPLFQKLGITDGTRIDLLDGPKHYRQLLEGMPSGVTVCQDDLLPEAGFIHWFVVWRADLEKDASHVASNLGPRGTLWVSWPKKSSALHGDVDEQTLRDVLLPLGIVDVKVCAVDSDWSGLKFLWRRK